MDSNTISNSRQRKQRRNLSLEDKINIIKRKEADVRLSDEKLANELGVDRSTISGILRKKEKLLQLHANAKNSDLKKLRIRVARFPSLEEALYKWFQSLRSRNVPVSQDILKNKAIEFYNRAKENGAQLPNFEASNGWLEKFQNRYDISSKCITGESESACLDQVENGRKLLQDIIATFNLESVYNADETGLFFRLGPNRTLASRNDKAKGIKKDKERVTVLLCCNATGTKKLKPFVIGKFKNPRCFKNVNLATLPVRYSNNRNAWMTMEKWNEWLKWLDNNVFEKSLLLVDNCPAHTDGFSLNLKNLRVEYIPPNTTSHIQPCDAGIIANFKAHYRNLLVSKWVYELNEEQKVKKLNIKEAIEFIADAWEKVKPSTINNCWKNTGILPVEIIENEMNIEETDDTITDLTLALNNLKLADPSVNITANEYLAVDNDLVSTELPTEEDIFEEFLIAEGVLQQQHVEEDSSDEEETIISMRTGRQALDVVKRFLEQRDFTTENDVKYIRNIIRRLDESVEKAKRQTSLTEFINQ